MNGQHTIMSLLQLRFLHASDAVMRIFDEIFDLLQSDLTNDSNEWTLNLEEMEEEIYTLAEALVPGGQPDVLLTIHTDIDRMLTNWWRDMQWARETTRISMETEDLIADLVDHITQHIVDNHRTRSYYDVNILDALLHNGTPQTGQIIRYPRQRLPTRHMLDAASEYYINLSREYGFGEEYRILLELLYIKMKRNSKRHLSFLSEDYRALCLETGRVPTYEDYLSYRGLTIPPAVVIHCKRLFGQKFVL